MGKLSICEWQLGVGGVGVAGSGGGGGGGDMFFFC